VEKRISAKSFSSSTRRGKAERVRRSAFRGVAGIRSVPFAALAGLVALSATGCRQPGPAAAKLVDRHGEVIERAKGSEWLATYVGYELSPGDLLRTGTASTARIRVGDGSVIRVGENALVRVRSTDLEALAGKTAVERPGELVLPPPAAPAVATARPAPAPAGPATAAPSTATTSTAATATPAPEVTVVAGESAIVHDDRAQLRVVLRFDQVCPDGGTVEIAHRGRRTRLTGEGAVTARLSRGRQIYRVRCAGQTPRSKPRAWGALALRPDSGTLPPSRHHQRSTIDADGRQYTVLLQARSPALALVWPNAAHPAKPLALHIKSGAGERVMRVKSAHTQLRAGALAEGTYTWWYAAGDGKQSPKTTVTLRLDKAAPIAQFFADADDPAAPGAIPVDGITLHDAKVSAAGRPVPVGDDGRFHAAVAPAAGGDAVAVRLELPGSGVHYFVRHRISRR
jgi:hypothetical protein